MCVSDILSDEAKTAFGAGGDLTCNSANVGLVKVSAAIGLVERTAECLIGYI